MSPPPAQTARQRYLRTMEFRPAEPPFTVPGWIWAETAEQWRREGWDGRRLSEVFGTDDYFGVEVDFGPCPRFRRQVIEEDAATRTVINDEGILLRELRTHTDTSMPQFLRFPVETEADYGRLAAERLGPRLNRRITPAWRRRVAGAAGSGLPLCCNTGRWGGYFGSLRNLMGLEGLCLAFYDRPALVERMMEERTETMIAAAGAVLDETEIDVFWFWEDMACNHGPLMSPQVFGRFALPHYRRVVDALRRRGVRHFALDSDGRLDGLIDLWLEAGIDFLWPMEAAAGMDVNAVRRRYGRSVALGGGIAKAAVARGGPAMRREVDRVMPLVADGGYIPELDHGVPPDITWPRFRQYMDYLLDRLGRG